MALDGSKAEVTALGKGRALAAQVRRVKFGLYTVPSQSEPGTYWTVVQRADGGRPCAHRAAVLVRRQREEVSARAAA